MQLTATQFEKLAGYFVDLAKVWFASGVIGFFFEGPSLVSLNASLIHLAGGAILSATFLTVGIIILKHA